MLLPLISHIHILNNFEIFSFIQQMLIKQLNVADTILGMRDIAGSKTNWSLHSDFCNQEK